LVRVFQWFNLTQLKSGGMDALQRPRKAQGSKSSLVS
jgi:hypothetical protein